jgi:S1-C subfamily serine protease
MDTRPTAPTGRLRRRTLLLTLAASGLIAGLCGFLGVALGGATVYFGLRQPAPPGQVSAQLPVDLPLADHGPGDPVADTVARIGPGVVTIVNYLERASAEPSQGEDPKASGSGFIVSDQGFIVTNNHVVEGAARLEVILADGSTVSATLIGVDPFADIAVVRVDGLLPAILSFGDSESLKPGQSVIAFGSPLGDFKNTVTVGVVSGKGRSVGDGLGYEQQDLIQTDAAINPGNSGGPLVNLAGEVIGVNTLVVRSSGLGGAPAEGLGFAVSSNTARAIVDELIATGRVLRPYLGVSWEAVPAEQAAQQGVPEGIAITEVVAGGPAELAGMQTGDILTALNGQGIDEEHPFINQLLRFRPGDAVQVDVYRSGQRVQLQITLAERPAA